MAPNILFRYLMIFFIFGISCLYAIDNRLSLSIATDESHLEQFGGNTEAAFNHSILFIDTINQHLRNEVFVYTNRSTNETYYYRNFGFDLKAVKLVHPAFDQFNNQQVINTTQLNKTLSSNALFKEKTDNSLVAFFTAKELSDGYKGFKCGTVCNPPYNTIAVSFYKCPLLEENEECLITTFHELLHGLGVEHSKDEDDDVMKKINASNMNMSPNTKNLVGANIFLAEIKPEGCLSKADDSVTLFYGESKVKTVKCQNVIKYMTGVGKEKATEIEAAQTTVQPPIEPDTEPPTSFLSKLSESLYSFGYFVTMFAIFVVVAFGVYKLCLEKAPVQRYNHVELAENPSGKVVQPDGPQGDLVQKVQTQGGGNATRRRLLLADLKAKTAETKANAKAKENAKILEKQKAVAKPKRI